MRGGRRGSVHRTGDLVATVDASAAFNLIYQESQTLLRMQESLGYVGTRSPVVTAVT
jgi:hypothetical protein